MPPPVLYFGFRSSHRWQHWFGIISTGFQQHKESDSKSCFSFQSVSIKERLHTCRNSVFRLQQSWDVEICDLLISTASLSLAAGRHSCRGADSQLRDRWRGTVCQQLFDTPKLLAAGALPQTTLGSSQRFPRSSDWDGVRVLNLWVYWVAGAAWLCPILCPILAVSHTGRK